MSRTDSAEKPSREEIAYREIGRTNISTGLARSFCVAFLLTVALPPLGQLTYELFAVGKRETPSSCILFTSLPSVGQTWQKADGSHLDRLLTANRQLLRTIGDFERQLNDRSQLGQILRGPCQQILAEWAGIGNESVYIGKNRSLFFRPDVEALTGPGFLEPPILRRRARGGYEHDPVTQPDPRPAILDFHRQLRLRGIQLVLVPIPAKAAIEPANLAAGNLSVVPVFQNPSFEAFCRELDHEGVLLFDPSMVLKPLSKNGDAQSPYLQTDSHWTPQGMQRVAEHLAEFVAAHAPLPTLRFAGFQSRMTEVENRGDLASLLQLSAGARLQGAQPVLIRQIHNADGTGWTSDPTADVLILGDSYTNIYSQTELNWGTSAGFAEQLAWVWQRPVDRLALNSGGASGTRQALRREQLEGRDRLAGKKLVIWEFAVRELTSGDWSAIPLTEAKSPSANAKTRDSAAESIRIQGVVRQVSETPRPGSVPYRDAIVAVHLTDVAGFGDQLKKTEVVLFVWGLRDNRVTSASKWNTGQTVSLIAVPWSIVRAEYERFNRIELDDPEFRLIELPVYWGEISP